VDGGRCQRWSGGLFPATGFNILLDKQDTGYFHAGYSEYRKYFDDTGGFYLPFSESSFDLDKDLHLDIGKAFVEGGLTLPHLPKVIVGYEHRFKDGRKSLLEWGSVTEGGVTRKIFPSFKDIDEKIDIVRFEVSGDIAGVQLGDEFRYEYYRADTTRHDQDITIGDPAATKTYTIDEDYKHDAFYNTLHAETFLNDNIFLSLGYLYTTLDGDASFRITTVPFDEQFNKDWFSNAINMNQEIHIVNFNTVLGPFRETTFYVGIEGESKDRQGNTDAILTEIPFGGTAADVVSPEALIDTDEDKWSVEETVGIRYTGLPRTTLYAEGRWTQQGIDLSETEIEDATEVVLDRDTDTDVRRQRYSIGFNCSPWSRTTFAARYRYIYRSNDYDHKTDIVDGVTPNNVYSAFILDQDIKTNEVMAKISFQPLTRIRASFQYQYIGTDIQTDEDTAPPSSLQTANYDANIYTASLTATPYAGFFLTATASYQDVKLRTIRLADAPVKTYDGDVLSLAASAGLALDSKTNLNVQYIYSYSDNFKNFSDVGLPLGVSNQRHAVIADLSRQITKSISARLRYGFYSYDDEASDGSDNYTANLVGAAIKMTF
jgi:hypothetical protein